ncbi:MAG: CapA family protein [Deltaproteobacteria bacterium]|nr:CapA family protein [Deltaproteobacteria bacterium]
MRLLFAGDAMLGRLVNRRLKAKPPEYPWGDTLQVFREADARVCNLECVISDRGEPWSATPKMFHFRSDKKNIACLKAAGMDAVTLANNHALDFGYEAVFEMFALLDSAGIARAGAGRDLEEAGRAAIFRAGGLTLSLISFTDNEPAWEAGDDRPGVFFLPVDEKDARAKRLFSGVKAAKKGSDIVIVSAHWGPNWGYSPVPGHIPFAHVLIESGADIVFGHSCHVFQGIEIYKGRPVIYSAGNFVDDYAVDEIERNDESFIFIVETEGDRITGMSLRPTVITDFQARLAATPRAGLIASRMETLCGEFRTRTRWDAEKGRLEISVI